MLYFWLTTHEHNWHPSDQDAPSSRIIPPGNWQDLRYQKVSSSHEPNTASNSNHHTMRGGEFIVDLLSAFGILHNISSHEPNIVLRPGAHSSAPAALFSSSYHSDSGSTGLRNVRLDLYNSMNMNYPFRSQSTSPISNNVSKHRCVKFSESIF